MRCLTVFFIHVLSGAVHGGKLARAPALQAGGQRFESVILHDSGADDYALCIMNYALERVL